MSLRWRLALALALLAGLATIATASFAYVSTRDRLNAENDRFLTERSATFPQVGPGQGGVGPPGGGPPTGEGQGDGNRPGTGDVIGTGGPGASVGSGRTGGAGGPGDPLANYDTTGQVLDDKGDITRFWGFVVLPVDDADRAIAAAGAGHRYHTVSVGGVPYRVCTVAVQGGALQVARDISETNRVLDALRWRFALVGLGVVAAGVVAGWLVARRTTKPLEELTTTAEHVAGTGELNPDGLAVTVATARRDETGRLARAFTTMLSALARSREQQQQLVQDASHELRTPLTSLRTNIEVLGRHRDLPEAQRSALMADLRSELGELSALVDELVLVASDQRDDEPARPVPLDDLVRLVAERAACRHGRQFRVHGRGGIVEAPPGALERVVTNLLDNAAKFGPPDTEVEITLAAGRVTVRDHGPGIDAADRPKIFDRFYRARSARPLPGSGLGLAIVRQVVEANGGSVFADNHALGGAVVGFELPVAITAPEPSPPLR